MIKLADCYGMRVAEAIRVDLLSAVLLGCFIFGFAAALVSFVLGGAEHFAFGGQAPMGDLGAGGGPELHGGPHLGPLPISSSTLLTFLTWFGGVGFILHSY